jgi:hypothetical protein
VLTQSIRRPWCPLVSYTGNLARIRDTLLGTDEAWIRVTSLFEAGREGVKRAAGFGPRFGPFRRQQRPAEEFDVESEIVEPSGWDPIRPPWTWSAGVLLGLIGISSIILSTRVRSLDRAR